MPATIFDSSIFRDIFTTPAMREVWSDENRVQKYLDFEAALARAQAKLAAILGEHDLSVTVADARFAKPLDEARVERLAAEWARKWDGKSWQFQVGEGGFEHEEGGTALVFAVEPTKVLAFGKSPFTHTRHRP